MKVEQSSWTEEKGWGIQAPGRLGESAQLVLVFAGSPVLRRRQCLDEIKAVYPLACIVGCSTAGEILDTLVLEESLTCTAIRFDQTRIELAKIGLAEVQSSAQAGERLVRALPAKGLVHVFVLSDGLKVNGSDLVNGMLSHLPQNVTVTGGLSGDGARFGETFVVWDDEVMSESIVAIGLYGDRLKVGYGSLGGWDAFGPERVITRAVGNILYELDNESALALYKKYLGEQAKGLPATGLLFPLSIRRKDRTPLVRTILSVNEQNQSMTFAGDIPEGAYARLMKANFDRLIDGAAGAATTSYQAVGSVSPELAILISSVGRKLVLGQRVEEEVENVRDALGPRPVLTGFYSYGEISPFTPSARCELHNQTMTVTTLMEA